MLKQRSSLNISRQLHTHFEVHWQASSIGYQRYSLKPLALKNVLMFPHHCDGWPSLCRVIMCSLKLKCSAESTTSENTAEKYPQLNTTQCLVASMHEHISLYLCSVCSYLCCIYYIYWICNTAEQRTSFGCIVMCSDNKGVHFNSLHTV